MLDLEFTSNEAGMCGYGLNIFGNHSSSAWYILDGENPVDNGTTGRISWDPVTSEIFFHLFGSSFFTNLEFTGYRSGSANPYDIINAGLEGDYIIPIPSSVWLIGFGFMGLMGLRKARING